MSVTKPMPTSRARFADELRRLADRVASTQLDDVQLTAMCDSIAAVADGCSGEARPPWWKRGPDYGAAYRSDSPMSGGENPWAPQLRIEAFPGVASPRALGRVRLGPGFAGPPRSVHGGLVAALFDEIFGALARAIDSQAIVVTATLDVRFRAPTPLDAELTFDAQIDRRSGRRVKASASCVAEGRETASARALMLIRPRPSRSAS